MGQLTALSNAEIWGQAASRPCCANDLPTEGNVVGSARFIGCLAVLHDLIACKASLGSGLIKMIPSELYHSVLTPLFTSSVSRLAIALSGHVMQAEVNLLNLTPSH